MHLSIKTKQVAGVTALVSLTVVGLSAWYLSRLASVYIEETKARADLVARTIVLRSFDIVASGGDARAALASDAGLQSILKASVTDPTLTYVAIVDINGMVIAHNDPAAVGQQLAPADDLTTLFDASRINQIRAIYAEGGRTYELRQQLLLAPAEPGSGASAWSRTISA